MTNPPRVYLNPSGNVVKRHRGRPRKDEPLVIDAYSASEILEFNLRFDRQIERHPFWWVPAPSGFDRLKDNRELDKLVGPHHAALAQQALLLALKERTI
jgi:hypothetical protein